MVELTQEEAFARAEAYEDAHRFEFLMGRVCRQCGYKIDPVRLKFAPRATLCSRCFDFPESMRSAHVSH